ncbi:MAG: hypothetical protein ACFFAN_10020 [Promethearchaeota archaeon]
MSGEKYNNFLNSLTLLQKKIDIFKQKKKELNNYIKDYITNFQRIESEFNNSFSIDKEFYEKKLNYYNKKIKKLRIKKYELKHHLKNLLNDKKHLQEPKYDEKDLKFIKSINLSIKNIDLKIEDLEKIIRTKNLDIAEEFNIVEEIRELETKKKEHLEELTKKEQEQIFAFQNNEYYINQGKIERVQINLKEINKYLKDWSIKKHNIFIKMSDLYNKANKLEESKKKMENELIETKKLADLYHLNFLKTLNHKMNIFKKKSRHTKVQEPLTRKIIEKKKMIKKLKQEKLAIALEKQKAGKRLDINEFKLILKESGKKI